MNNFYQYLTPEKARKLDQQTEGGRRKPLAYYQKLATNKAVCEICETEAVWRLADTGMCFSCTTGQADASDDYELALI